MIDAAKTIKHPSRFLRSNPVRGVIGVGAGASAGHAGFVLSPVTSSAVFRRPRSLPLAAARWRAHAPAGTMKYASYAIEFEGDDSVSIVTLNNPFRSGRVAV